MKTPQGFSLIEVLISLFLLTGTSLALLNQQWQTSNFFNQVIHQSSCDWEVDNALENQALQLLFAS